MNINDESLKPIIAKAILDSITQESRETLIKNSIINILNETTNTGGYGNRNQKSHIQRAFDEAVISYANRYATEILENNQEFKLQIESLFKDVAKKLFESQREDLIDSIATTIRHALTKDRY